MVTKRIKKFANYEARKLGGTTAFKRKEKEQKLRTTTTTKNFHRLRK